MLPFLATHLTIEAIAEQLGRSRSTVKTHIAHIYQKFGVTTRGEAVDRARELRLLAEPDGIQGPATSVAANKPRECGASETSWVRDRCPDVPAVFPRAERKSQLGTTTGSS